MKHMSWQTTTAGALIIIAAVLGMAFGRIDGTVGGALLIVGVGFVFARDDNKTSEDVGAPGALSNGASTAPRGKKAEEAKP